MTTVPTTPRSSPLAAGGDAPRQTTVYYLVGTAHSGSTLLAALLGEIQGHFTAAEMRMAWQDPDSRRCGCGRPLSGCPVWGSVLARAAERVGTSQQQFLGCLRHDRVASRNIPRILAHVRHGAVPLAPRHQAYGAALGHLYTAIQETTGATAVVDSSKSAAEAALLRTVPTVVVHLVHLVRDPRAVAYSGARSAAGKPHRRDKMFLERAARYVAVNRAAELVAGAFNPDRRTIVRYEDLVHDPGTQLRRIVMDRTGTDITAPGPLACPSRRHMLGGNALRFARGPIDVRAAEQTWRRQLPRSASNMIALMARSPMRRYGYATDTR